MAHATVGQRSGKADARRGSKALAARDRTEGAQLALIAPTSAASLLGLPAAGPLAMIKRLEAGLRFETLEHFQKKTQLSTVDLATMIDIKVRTLRRRKDEGRLEPDESDRLLRASMIFAKALDLFEGDADAARHWFDTPAKALGGARPREFARTQLGTREIEALINRIEHGVFS